MGSNAPSIMDKYDRVKGGCLLSQMLSHSGWLFFLRCRQWAGEYDLFINYYPLEAKTYCFVSFRMHELKLDKPYNFCVYIVTTTRYRGTPLRSKYFGLAHASTGDHTSMVLTHCICHDVLGMKEKTNIFQYFVLFIPPSPL